MEEGADINPHDLMTLGYSQKDIKQGLGITEIPKASIETAEEAVKASRASKFLEATKKIGGKALGALDKLSPIGDAMMGVEALSMIGNASRAYNQGIPSNLIKDGTIGSGAGLKVTPELLKQGDEQFRSMFPQFAGENGIGVFHEAFNDYVKQNNIDLSKSSVYAQYTEEGLKFHSVPKTLEQQAEYIHSRINDTMNASIQSQIPNVGSVSNVAHPVSPIQTNIAATGLYNPISNQEAAQSIVNQVQQIMTQQPNVQTQQIATVVSAVHNATAIKPISAIQSASATHNSVGKIQSNPLENLQTKIDYINTQTTEAVDILSGEVTEQIEEMQKRMDELNDTHQQESELDKYLREN